MERLLTHKEAAAKYGPTQAYVSATQPRWVTVVHRLGTAALIIGGVTVLATVAHLIWFDEPRPHIVLTAFAAGALGVGALALLPMVIYRSAKGLPAVQDGRFVPLTAPRIFLVVLAYLIIFCVASPLVIQDVFRANSPDWLEELARSSSSIMTVLKFIF